MTITILQHQTARRRGRGPDTRATPSRPPEWLEFVAFFAAFLVLTGLAMVFRFHVYGPGDVWSRLGQIFG
jgi:hypothetical protein